MISLAEVLREDSHPSVAEAVKASMAEFACEKSAHLQEFARGKVAKWESHGHSRTYVMLVAADERIDVAAFFTIGMAMLDMENVDPKLVKRLSGEISTPRTGAFSIAELARSDAFSTAQLPGSVILDEAKAVILEARKLIGGRFVVVDSRPEVFERLYQPAGFRVIARAEAPRGMEDAEFVTSCAVAKNW